VEEKLDRLLEGFYDFKKSMEANFESVNSRLDNLENRMDGLEEKMDKGFEEVPIVISELNLTQRKILNSIDLVNEDIKNNRRHITALEEKEKYV